MTPQQELRLRQLRGSWALSPEEVQEQWELVHLEGIERIQTRIEIQKETLERLQKTLQEMCIQRDCQHPPENTEVVNGYTFDIWRCKRCGLERV